MTKAFVSLFALICFQISAQLPTGDWYGNLDIMGQQLSIVIHVSEDSIYLDSPDQNVYGIPADSSSISQSSLFFKSNQLAAKYNAEYSANPDTLTGTFQQGGMKLDLNMSRSGVEKKVVNRPQEPKPPFDYKVEEVTFSNKKEKIKLAGTLTIPRVSEEEEVPVVVMITGSGPQDRNEEIMGHKPFWVIADHLANNGIACLRYDDRGFGQSEGNFHQATTHDLANDVAAAVKFLKKRKEFSSIGLVGHSEGGLITPMVASKNNNVDFIVLLAGTGVNGFKVLEWQQELIMKASGDKEENYQPHLIVMKQLNEFVLEEDDPEVAINKGHQFIDSLYKTLNDEQKEYVGDLRTYKMQLSMQMSSPWWKEFLIIEPSEYLSQLKVPTLALFGGKDLQVDPQQNEAPLKEALSKSKAKYEVKTFPNKNHLFQNTKTGKIEEYGSIEETISEDVLEYFTQWIIENAE